MKMPLTGERFLTPEIEQRRSKTQSTGLYILTVTNGASVVLLAVWEPKETQGHSHP